MIKGWGAFKLLPLPKLVTFVCLENHISYVYFKTQERFFDLIFPQSGNLILT